MTIINSRTKISALIKANPGAIEALASINSHFHKLRSPFLRKILAARVTIAEAAKMGGVTIAAFYERLIPLGFQVQGDEQEVAERAVSIEGDHLQAFDRQLDVTEDLNQGKDPFRVIMKEVNELRQGEVLQLVSPFEPVPLIRVLTERGLEAKSFSKSADEWFTYIRMNGAIEDGKPAAPGSGDFEAVLSRFEGKAQTVDVRQLPMPQPMMTILSRLEELREGEALFVHHKKVPMFLLPQLTEKGWAYTYRSAGEGVEMIIYREVAE